MGEPVRTTRGRMLDELTVEAVLAGELTIDDLRISADTVSINDHLASKTALPSMSCPCKPCAILCNSRGACA